MFYIWILDALTYISIYEAKYTLQALQSSVFCAQFGNCNVCQFSETTFVNYKIFIPFFVCPFLRVLFCERKVGGLNIYVMFPAI